MMLPPNYHHHQHQQNKFINNSLISGGCKNNQMCSKNHIEDTNNNAKDVQNMSPPFRDFTTTQLTCSGKSRQLKETHSALVKILESAPINKSEQKSSTATITNDKLSTILNQNATKDLTPSKKDNENDSIILLTIESENGQGARRASLSPQSQPPSLSYTATLITTTKNVASTQPPKILLKQTNIDENTPKMRQKLSIDNQNSTTKLLYRNKNCMIYQQPQHQQHQPSHQQQTMIEQHHHYYHRKRNKHLINAHCDNIDKSSDEEVGCNSNSSASSNASEAELICPWKKTRIAREWHQSQKLIANDGDNDSQISMKQKYSHLNSNTANTNMSTIPSGSNYSSSTVIISQDTTEKMLSDNNIKLNESIESIYSQYRYDQYSNDGEYDGADIDSMDESDIDEFGSDAIEDDDHTLHQCNRHGSLIATGTVMNAKNHRITCEHHQRYHSECHKRSWRHIDHDADDEECIEKSSASSLNGSQRNSSKSPITALEVERNSAGNDSGDSDCPENISELCKKFDQNLSEQDVSLSIFVLCKEEIIRILLFASLIN